MADEENFESSAVEVLDVADDQELEPSAALLKYSMSPTKKNLDLLRRCRSARYRRRRKVWIFCDAVEVLDIADEEKFESFAALSK